jgi:O-antigen ligase
MFLFLLHSRVFDLTLSFLHIPIITLWAAAIAAFVGGGLLPAFANRIGLLMALLSAWMVMGIPFSVWPGGAAGMAKEWMKTLLVFFVIAALIKTFAQFRRAIIVLAFSVLTLALLTIPFGSMAQGRLALPRGRFTNPNDLGQILLMGLPFWWFLATNPKLKRSRRVWAWLAMVPIFATMAKTGSRGALIAFLVVSLVLFWRSSVGYKVLMTSGALTLVLMAAVFLPKATRDRYFTIFGEDDPAEQAEQSVLQSNIEASAVSSTWARWQLLRDSISLTFAHPVFGVGAGQFAVAQDLYSQAVRQRKGAWQVTHNTFTEISSENGLPGLLFFVLAIYYTFRRAGVPRALRARGRPKYDEVSSLSFCLRLSLLAFVTSALFGSFAYATQFPVLAALVVAFHRVAPMELARLRPPAPVAGGGGQPPARRSSAPLLGASA